MVMTNLYARIRLNDSAKILFQHGIVQRFQVGFDDGIFNQFNLEIN